MNLPPLTLDDAEGRLRESLTETIARCEAVLDFLEAPSRNQVRYLRTVQLAALRLAEAHLLLDTLRD